MNGGFYKLKKVGSPKHLKIKLIRKQGKKIRRRKICNKKSYFIFQVGHQIDDLFQSCTWQGKPLKCKDIFHLQKTEEGFCYSFNSRTSEPENET